MTDRNPLTRILTPVSMVVMWLPMIAGSLNSQIKPPASNFAVASIRLSDPKAQRMSFEVTPDGGIRATAVTLRVLLQKAYGVDDFQIEGGPNWARSERFDVFAKPESGPPADETSPGAEQLSAELARQRLTVLLAERFQLVVRQHFRDGAIYMLEQTKTGHKLKAVTGTDGIRRNRGLISAENATMAMLARTLSVTLQRPVLDETGLPGKYAFRLEWAEAGAPGEPEESGISLFTAIQEQLGVRLDAGKGPIKIISVDRADKPSAN